MNPACRVGVDAAGGTIVSSPKTLLRHDGVPLAVVGSPVAGHGTGAHGSASMATGSTILRVDGQPVCISGSAATCGHVAVGTSIVRCES